MKRKKIVGWLMIGTLALGAMACGKSESEKEIGTEENGDIQQKVEENLTQTDAKEEEIEEVSEETEGDIVEQEGRKDKYMEALLDIYNLHKFPDGSELWYEEGEELDLSQNYFAVCDIDGDGKRELIFQYSTTITAGMSEIIYSYEEDTKELREQFREYPLLTYYDNGMIEAGWSHNQGLAGDFWPYTLWQYEKESDTYHEIASVDAWDDSLLDGEYSDGVVFPKEIDKDGDRIVYYITPPGEEKGDPVDGPEYQAWRDSYLDGAKTITVPYQELTEQNIYMVE